MPGDVLIDVQHSLKTAYQPGASWLMSRLTAGAVRKLTDTQGRYLWPLTDRMAIVELIGATTTKAGLRVECALDTRTYEKGIKVSDAEMAALNITGDDFHPEWDYTIKPSRHRRA